MTDQGLENEMLRGIAAELQPGKSAILAVIDHTSYSQMADAIEGYETVLYRAGFADEAGGITFTD